jgi:amino acid adenylation domain-containing protein/natural product biosynthesis luciferase-like monooxygenase protein
MFITINSLNQMDVSMDEIIETGTAGLEIAVIGMAGRFPDADNVGQLWTLLRDGREGLAQLSDEQLASARVPEAVRRDPRYVPKRGSVNRKREFDAELFGYTAADAAVIDPQFAVFHELAWEALEDAGYAAAKYHGNIGLFAGATGNLSWIHKVMQSRPNSADYFGVASLTELGYLATRVAHRLDLTGPALTTNTTCSTSLVNIHQACQSLITGDCDIALAGGVSIGALENKGYLYQEDMVLSPDGSCRAFDVGANGTAAGEGGGILVLKRLDDALADGDRILAVIKGSAINNDGQRKSSYMAPSSEGQAKVIASALQRAEVTPDSISYVEAHGTGTKLGDPIEVAGLRQVFAGQPAGHCAIGSVKTNIGHLGEAAGVAGAIKVILSMQHRQLPASLHYSKANPHAGLEGSPLVVNHSLRDWQARGGSLLRAGVSSFGIGGTNAHIVLEEAPPAAAGGAGRSLQLATLSAHTDTALAAQMTRLAAHLRATPDMPLADACYTLHMGRNDLRYRRAFVADSSATLAGLLERPGAAPAKALVGEASLCFVFPGQGSQYTNMGRELYRSEAVFREAMDECFALASSLRAPDLKAILYPQQDDAPALLDTAVVQPLLFIYEYALARQLQHWGCQSQAYAGHSLGEYVAACLAGVFSLRDALAVVIERGRLVGALPGGAMLAVTASEQQAQEWLGDGISLAAVNAPQRIVLSGDTGAIDALEQRLAQQGIVCTRLHTSHAFHSHHLDPVLDCFGQFLSGISLQAPQAPVVSNVTGDWLSAEQATSPAYWVRQLRAPVRFADGIATLCRDSARVLAEVGPGRSLSNFALQHDAGAHEKVAVAFAPSARQHAPGQELASLLDGLGQLFVHGVALDWAAFYAGQQRRRVALPTYPFEGRCYYPAAMLVSAPASAAAAASPAGAIAAAVAVPAEAPAVAAVAAAGSSVQQKLQAIWAGFLGVPEVAPDEDLFNVGVDSLLSIRAIAAIREAFKTDLSLDTLFVLRTVAEQAAEIERRLGQDTGNAVPPIIASGSRAPAPLSTSQQRLWIISQLERNHTAYNTAFFHFSENVDVAALEQTFRTIIERHAILRTVYRQVDGVPLQNVREHFDFAIEKLDITDLPPEQRYRRGQELWRQALLTPISLSDDLMIRVRLVRYEGETHLLMVTQHHICSDNWSTNLLMEEISTLYAAYAQGAPNPLPPLPVQYLDYALWQNEWLATGALESELAYWTKHLAGIPAVHSLPLDHPRPAQQSYRGRQYTVRLNKGVLAGLQKLSQQHGATLFMTMQAAFAVLLGRYSGNQDIVTGFSVANRLHKELESVIGFFVNTLVMRSDLSGDPGFGAFLERTRQSLLSAYANQHVPFEKLVDALRPARSLSYEPVVQVMLIFLDQSQAQGGRKMLREIANNDAVLRDDMNVPFSKYDLSLYFSVVDDTLELTWEYATDLFEAATIARMSDNFSTLLAGIVADAARPLTALPLVSEPDLGAQFAFGNSQADPARLAAAALAGQRAMAEHSVRHFAFSLFYFASDNGARASDKYKLLMEGARYADLHGFEAVWTPERHFDAFGGTYPNPAIAAAALASMTSRVHLRAGSCVLPLHNPVRVAEDWSVVDNISGGRVGIGFAAGYSARDFTLAPDKFENRRDILIGDISKVKALWRGDGVFMPNGKGELAEIQIRPRPLQPELPVWVTTVGNEEAFRQAGRNGDFVLSHLMGQSLDELSAKIAVYRAERKAAGHPGEGHVTILVHTFIAGSEEVIFEQVKEPFKKYLIDSVGTPQAIARSLGGGADGSDHDIEAVTEFAFQRYYQSNALLGTAERCLPLVEAIRAAGVNEIACLIDFGVESQLVLDNLPNLNRLKEMALAAPHMAATAETTPTTHAPQELLHQLVETQALRHPDALALRDEKQDLSYHEANRRANRLAHRLIAMGVKPDQRVAICAERSVEMVVGILAVLKAGGAYVPLDPSYPLERLGFMLEDSAPLVLLTQSGLVPRLPALEQPVLLLDDDAALAGASEHNPDPEALGLTPQNLAYVIYTSGSTGLPKGAMNQHDGIVNHMRWASGYSPLGAGDVMLQKTPFGFDVSLWDIFLPLMSGVPLVIARPGGHTDPAYLVQTIQREQITVLHFVPSMLALFLEQPQAAQCRSLRMVMCAGEALPYALYQRFAEMFPGVPLHNLYGPTEAAVHTTAWECSPNDAHRVPIGRPISNLQFYILDGRGQPVPQGVAGELHIGGVGVCRGYLNRPELTAERFPHDPFAGRPGARMYRTGDLGRWLADGSIEYLGRNDFQVKLRGQRVELGEIEARLRDCDGVRDAVVTSRADAAGDRYLVAYLLPEAGALIENVELRRELAARLPEYMVPSAIVVMDAWPLNASGKLDRAALPAPGQDDRAAHSHEAPLGATETMLAEIWQELLLVPQIGPHDNFFEVGGHSLAAIRLAHVVAERFGVELDTRAVFEMATVASLAAHVETLLWQRGNSNVPATDDQVEIEL